MESNAKLDISLNFGVEGFDIKEESVTSRRSSIRSFLPGISKVRDMTISAFTFKVFHQYSKLEPLPQFGCMSRLHAKICVSHLKWLPTFLEYCPNLKSLVLDLYGNYEGMNQISFSSVPGCLLTSLEIVDLKAPISGYAAEMKLVKYLLENSAILKKLTLRLISHSAKDDIFKNLLKIPRRSANCQVVVI